MQSWISHWSYQEDKDKRWLENDMQKYYDHFDYTQATKVQGPQT